MKPFRLIGLFALLLSACSAPPIELATFAPTLTAVPTRAAAPASTSTIAPSPTPTITPTPQPQLIQLTSNGCCVNPSWSPDSKQVLFIDKPATEANVGYYAIDAAGGAGGDRTPRYMGRVGVYSPDRSLAAFAEGSKTIVERISTGESWVMPNEGKAVEFSFDNRRVAWEAEAISGPYDQRQNEIYVATFDGKNAERVTRVYGGGIVGWLPNNAGLMFSGRPSLQTHESTLTVLDINTNTAADLVSVERLSGISISNGGTWVAYFISFNDDATRNGIWVQRTDGSEARKLDQWGAYQWRDDSHLLLIPTRTDSQKPFDLWDINAATGQGKQLTSGATTSLTILNGDWRVSPDGKAIVFVNSADRNLWLLKLP